MNNLSRPLSLIIAIAIPLLIGAIGSIFTQASVSDWYLTLEKPFFNPPGFVFPIAWTFLYISMGLASWFMWDKRKESPLVNKALVIYGVHLIFNLMWSYLFFTLKNPPLAFAEILILLALIIYTTRLFFRISSVAGWLMVPYIAWVSFATILNGSIVWLN